VVLLSLFNVISLGALERQGYKPLDIARAVVDARGNGNNLLKSLKYKMK
jgi:hypothetical protein